VARAYIVCSTPRSGSTLLGAGLRATGVAGLPQEYFNPNRRARWAAEWDCGTSLRSYVEALLARRTGANGVFGFKLHWQHFEQLRAEALGLPPGEPSYDASADFLTDLFGPLRYVHIVRRDLNRQAISHWTAGRTGRWYRASDAPAQQAPIPYSFEWIARIRAHLANAEVHWDRFFRFNAIEPVTVVYEDLVADYGATVGAVVAELVPEASDVTVPEPQSARQGDERTEQLLERFRHDLDKRSPDRRLPPPPLAARVVYRFRSAARLLP
jgi:LPS sulfotransferase NodH